MLKCKQKQKMKQVSKHRQKKMKMKHKLYIFSILLAFGMNVKAQTQSDDSNSPEVGTSTFGIYGGVNFQNINGKDAMGIDLSNSLVPRFTIGVNYEIAIAPEFYIQPGVQFVTKGTKGPMEYKKNADTYTVTREINMNYIEVPLNLVFKPNLGRGFVVLGLGPYVGYSVGGKAKFEGSTKPEDSDIQFADAVPTNDENNLVYFKRMDTGANLFVGYEVHNGINILLNTQLGLLNINSSTTSKMENKNTGFGLTLGYRF
jgi:hypothetical protein